MNFNQLKVNDEVIYYGKNYTVLSINPPKVSIIRSAGDGESISVNLTDLVTDSTFRHQRTVTRDSHAKEKNTSSENFQNVLDGLTEKKRKEVSRRIELIKPLLLLDKAKQGSHRSRHEFITQYKEFLLDNQSVEELTQGELLERITQKYSILNEYGEKTQKVL